MNMAENGSRFCLEHQRPTEYEIAVTQIPLRFRQIDILLNLDLPNQVKHNLCVESDIVLWCQDSNCGTETASYRMENLPCRAKLLGCRKNNFRCRRKVQLQSRHIRIVEDEMMKMRLGEDEECGIGLEFSRLKTESRVKNRRKEE